MKMVLISFIDITFITMYLFSTNENKNKQINNIKIMENKKEMHFLRIEAKSARCSKTLEFPINEATEEWLLSLEKTDDELTSDFIVSGNKNVKICLSIVNRGLEF